jgi:hypothetical protein
MLTGMKNMSRNSAPEKHDPGRRRLLRSAAVLIAFLTASTRGLSLHAQTANYEDAEDHLRQTLGQLSRRLFPHDALPAAPYEEIAAALINRAATDPGFAGILRGGVASLDSGSSTPWLRRDDVQQVAAIRKLESGAFFRLMRTTTIEHLYRNRAVWKLLGYEGSSVEYGGYVDRGFDDIDWLPGSSNQQ